jgi:hypothetical protein
MKSKVSKMSVQHRQESRRATAARACRALATLGGAQSERRGKNPLPRRMEDGLREMQLALGLSGGIGKGGLRAVLVR